jgi:hypothetical protein
MKPYISELILEVTRKCNMKCMHCLRGDAENLDMTTETVDKILDQINAIGNISWTGGEPLLNKDLIIYSIDQIMHRQIEVSTFYLVTNGTLFDNELFLKLMEFYFYCQEPAYCRVNVSIDDYHEEANEKYLTWWKGCAFYSNNHDRSNDFDFYNRLIDTGLANENGIGSIAPVIPDGLSCEFEDDWGRIQVYGIFYVNANGDIVADCDMSYEMQEYHIQGNVDNIEEALKESLVN